MSVVPLQKLFTTSNSKSSQSQKIFWLSLSLTFSCVYSFLALRQAFSSEYVVQDDARQHIFWMQRFLEAGLFPNDLIADYFQSVAPAGYTAVYQTLAGWGINPLVANKLLPTVLGLVTTGYCFNVCWELFPVPAAGFISTLLLNQSLWMKDDLISATPRGFVYPLFLAFMYYLLRRSLFPTCVTIALLGLFYPQGVFNAVLVLMMRSLRWQKGLPRLSPNPKDYLICAVGIGTAVLVMLPFALEASAYSPTITAAAARQLPEFLPGGRSAFFSQDPWRFWLSGGRSGFLPSIQPSILAVGFLLPILCRYPASPLVQKVTSLNVLLQLIIAATVMFFAAHAMLFKLHLPGRYTGYSLRIVLALAAAIALIVVWDALWHFFRQQFVVIVAVLLGVALIIYPSFAPDFPNTKYKVGNYPALYQFFQQQPQDSLIASLAEEANNLPTFAQQSILVGREYAIPYHWGFYRQFRQRTLELIRAQYSPNLQAAQTLIQQYGVDFWLLDRAAFTPEYVADNSWFRQYQPVTAAAIAQLQQGKIPALSQIMKRCSIFTNDSFTVLSADCISKAQDS